MTALKVLALFCTCICLALCDMEHSSHGVTLDGDSTHLLDRRYSEGTLASDFSKTVENRLKKNFVEWLLTRREKKSHPSQETSKRDVDSQNSAITSQEEAGLQIQSMGRKPFFAWLLKNREESFPTDVKTSMGQSLLDLLISEDMRRERMQ